MTLKKNESNYCYQMLKVTACRASRLNDELRIFFVGYMERWKLEYMNRPELNCPYLTYLLSTLTFSFSSCSCGAVTVTVAEAIVWLPEASVAE